MKDSISYDLAHHQQQHNPSSWNQQRQSQQTHSPNVYSNHHNAQPAGSQARNLGSHQQQQQHHHHLAQLSQYSHQQLQSVTHHGNNASSSAYYGQAHLYPGFQDQQQAGSPHQHHHHPPSATVTSSSATTPVLNAAATQQQHSNTQVSGLHHAGWSSGVGALTTQAHHAVVTDHSALAYLPHGYQSHNSNLTEHSRNTTGPLANQPIGTGPQASSYALDSLYNSPAAAAVAAYGYNNYNTAFFQTSNNGPHTQSGHPAQANLSAFWNHHSTSQQHRTSHSQGVDQTSLQQRQQQLATEQSANYMHDPRLYYMRPSYDQVLQNFGQNQTQIQSNQQQQSDLTHSRISSLTQQQPLADQQDLESQRFEQGHQLQQQSSISGQTATVSNSQVGQQNNVDSSLPSHQHATLTPNQHGIKMQTSRVSPQHPVQKQSSTEANTPALVKSQINHEQQPATKSLQSTIVKPPASQKLSNNQDDAASTSNLSNQTRTTSESDQLVNSQSNAHKTQSVMKYEIAGQYQAQKQQPKTTGTPQVQSPRNNYRSANEERQRSDLPERIKNHREPRAQAAEAKRNSQNQSSAGSQQTQNNPDLVQSVEDSLATLAISSKKTTWASIASQPAKVAQPKSLKSKISGSNSVLSSAKHLTTSVALDPSNLDSKNGINPAIKSSVSTAATSLQRGSVPPPIAKINMASKLNLDLLVDDGLGSSKISWPAVNASINLSLDEPMAKKERDQSSNTRQTERFGREEETSKQDVRESSYRDHNHNQGLNTRLGSGYQNSSEHREPGRDYRNEEYWGSRRGPRDNRARRDSDRRDAKMDDRMRHEEPRNQRREYRPANRVTNFRGEDVLYRDNKRGHVNDRNEPRVNNMSRLPPNSRHDQPRDQQSRSNDVGPHHHYSNLRDGHSISDPQGKLDLNLHPHLNPANYNPKEFNCEPENARYFIIKSYSEDDIHRSIKYSIWCSTNHGNKRLEEAYRQQQATNGQIFLFFSVNGSGHFCGMAQMTSAVDFDSSSGVWAQSKWQGEFSVKWIYVKDVPNSALRHITLENNEGKPVTNSRDTQEVPNENGKAVLSIIHKYTHTTSLFDDFLHYERRQEEEKMKKSQSEQQHYSGRADERSNGGHRFNRPYNNSRGFDFRENSGNRDRASRFES